MNDAIRLFLPYIAPPLLRHIIAHPGMPCCPTTHHFPAAVLFVDISGFTTLTELLARTGNQGVETLTAFLDSSFQQLIALLEAEGGEVVTFNGDALTVLFPATSEPLSHAVRRAYQAALAMQSAMQQFPPLHTSLATVTLGIKIAIGAGEVVTMQVGGVTGRWEYVVAGDPLIQVATADSQAARGEIRLSPEAAALLSAIPLPSCPLLPLDWTTIPDSSTLAETLCCYIPRLVCDWLQQDLRDWLNVLRPMTVLFLNVIGLDYTAPDTILHLHALVRTVQETAHQYEGSVNSVVVDDKGTVLLVLFGAPPLAHEDDAARAVQCALDIQSRLLVDVLPTPAIRLAQGIASGWVFAGSVGSATRRKYTAMGDAVNLAARLMVQARATDILCDFATYQQARSRTECVPLAPVRLKGKAGLVRVYRPVRPASPPELNPRLKGHHLALNLRPSPLIGRTQEVAHLTAALDALAEHHGRVILIEGEAGIGKSRLVTELARLVRERGFTGLFGAGKSIEQQTPYRAWRDLFSAYFFALEALPELAARQERVRQVVHEVAPEHLERLPLLNDVLNLGLPDTPLTATLDPARRQQSLVMLLLDLLRGWVNERPLIIILEDTHWLDSLSWDLTVQIVRRLPLNTLPLLMVLVTRSLDAHPQANTHITEVQALSPTQHLHLCPLTSDELEQLVAAHLKLPTPVLPAPVVDLLRQKAGGNPFFAEAFVSTLLEQGTIQVEEHPQQPSERRCMVKGDMDKLAQTLPATVQGLIMTRMDRLPPEQQLLLRVASVIGLTFAYETLQFALTRHTTMDEATLRAHLDSLARLDLTLLYQPEPDLIYTFKHAIVQEVAYQTMLFAQRRLLHRTVAAWYEATPDPAALSAAYPLLVHHYRQAEDNERERHYAWLTSEQAIDRSAHTEAVVYLSRVLALTPETDTTAQYRTLRKRMQVYSIQGARAMQQADLEALMQLAITLDDSYHIDIALHQAEYADEICNYPSAIASAQQVIALARTHQSTHHEAAGYLLWGRICWKQGGYADAHIQLTHALHLAHTAQARQVEANTLRNLGVVAYYQHEYHQARAYHIQAQRLHRSLGDRRGEGSTFINLGAVTRELGDYVAAHDYCLQGLQVFLEIGDRMGESAIRCNLATTLRDLGDYAAARAAYEQSLQICREIDNHQVAGEAMAYLALVSYLQGETDATLALVQQAIAVLEDIGDREQHSAALTWRGHALSKQGRLDAARCAYQQALDLRQAMSQANLAMDPLAGLARVALAQGQRKQAHTMAEAILQHLTDGSLDGTIEPMRVALTCYRVLHEARDIRADTVLATAYHLLHQRAAHISEAALKHQFLAQLIHQEILREVRCRCCTRQATRRRTARCTATCPHETGVVPTMPIRNMDIRTRTVGT